MLIAWRSTLAGDPPKRGDKVPPRVLSSHLPIDAGPAVRARVLAAGLVRAAAVLLALATGCVAPNPAYDPRVQTQHDASPAPDLAPGPDASLPDTAHDAVDAVGVVDGRPPDLAPIDVGTDVGRIDGATAPAPLGAWHLDDGAGSPTVADSSGKGAVGTLVDLDPARAWVAGRKDGTALEFNPTTASPHPAVRVPLTVELEGLQRFTVAAWIFRTGLSKPMQAGVISQQLGDTNEEVFGISVVNDLLTAFAPSVAGGVSHAAKDSTSLPFGSWIHVAATFDGREIRLYRNGGLVGSTAYAYALPVSAKPITIGTNVNPGGLEQPFVGYLDDVYIFGAALSDAAIADLASP
jgi:hypothetical protein